MKYVGNQITRPMIFPVFVLNTVFVTFCASCVGKTDKAYNSRTIKDSVSRHLPEKDCQVALRKRGNAKRWHSVEARP